MTPADLDRAIDQLEQIMAQVDHPTYEQSLRLYSLSIRLSVRADTAGSVTYNPDGSVSNRKDRA